MAARAPAARGGSPRVAPQAPGALPRTEPEPGPRPDQMPGGPGPAPCAGGAVAKGAKVVTRLQWDSLSIPYLPGPKTRGRNSFQNNSTAGC